MSVRRLRAFSRHFGLLDSLSPDAAPRRASVAPPAGDA
jgi:hypothetical protein